MQASLNGNEVMVFIPLKEVQDFAYKWPCFGKPKPLTFYFQPSGDLIDIRGDEKGDVDDHALVALCEDAWKYAQFRLGL